MEEKENKALRGINKFLPIGKKIIAVFGLVVILLATVGCAKDDAADTAYLMGVLEQASELTTAKVNYTGLYDFKEGEGISFINKSEFTMRYDATARFGIDIAKVTVEADDKEKVIYVTLPPVEIQEVKVDADSIQYYNDKFTLFDGDQKENANEAIAKAEEKAKEELAGMGIVQMAQDQAETLIRGILADAVPDGYDIEFK